MILYNTTFTFHNPLLGSFSEWLRERWLPEAHAAGLTDSTVARLMAEIDPEATAFAAALKHGCRILMEDGALKFSGFRC